MTLSRPDLDFLTSDAGARVLERLAADDLSDDYTLRLLTSLRRDLTPEWAGAALELARLRQKAAAKFGTAAGRMYFTRDALEQASAPVVANWRAVAFSSARSIVDACCGIGADALAFARGGGHVVGLDIDPVRVAMARLNAEALGFANARFEVADVREGLPAADLIFFDPARRTDDGKRIFDVERYLPPLSTIRSWDAQQIAVKLSPGVDLAQLQPYGAAVSFVSAEGELKEALLVKGGEPVSPAVLLVGNMVYEWQERAVSLAPVSEPRTWLVEPDPALIRAGLVGNLALELDGALLDAEIAYLTTDDLPASPWARAWRILDWMPFNLKKLRAYLRAHDVGTVTVKKRGTAVTPEDLITRLKLNGSGSRTIVLTRCRGAHIILVCEDLRIGQAG